MSIFDHDRLQTTVGPADVAADALRVCPMASGFGFADHVIIIIIIPVISGSYCYKISINITQPFGNWKDTKLTIFS